MEAKTRTKRKTPALEAVTPPPTPDQWPAFALRESRETFDSFETFKVFGVLTSINI